MLLVHRVPVQFPSGKGIFVWMAWSVVVAFGNRHVAINTHTLTNDVLWMGGLPWHITCHDDVTKWKHFLRYWPCVQGNSPVTGPWLTAPSHHLKERTQHFTATDDTTLTCCTIQTAVSHACVVSFAIMSVNTKFKVTHIATGRDPRGAPELFRRADFSRFNTHRQIQVVLQRWLKRFLPEVVPGTSLPPAGRPIRRNGQGNTGTTPPHSSPFSFGRPPQDE